MATTLASGDLVITGFNFDNPDEFSFVPLVDITIGTEIQFTDDGVRNNGTFRGSEGTFTWNAVQDYSARDVITPTVTNVAHNPRLTMPSGAFTITESVSSDSMHLRFGNPSKDRKSVV